MDAIESKQAPMPDAEIAAPQGLSAKAFVQVLWNRKTAVLTWTGGVAVLVFLVSFFLLPKYYKATATLLPETEKGRMPGAASLSSIAEIAGINLGQGATMTKLYPTVLSSDAVMIPVIQRKYANARFAGEVTLIQYLGLEDYPPEEQMARALKELRDLFSANVEARTNAVSLTLEMREPQVAADVLNAMIDELDRFMREKRKSSATEQTKWIGTRIKEVEPELRTAEERLKGFRERNRRVMDSPELLLEQERLLRDVQIRTTVYGELKKQFELSRIEEVKNIPVVNVLDEARPPVKKERPKAVVNGVIAALITLAVQAFLFVVWPRWRATVREFFGRPEPPQASRA